MFYVKQKYKQIFQATLGIILLLIVLLQLNFVTLHDQLINAPIGYLVPSIFIYYILITSIWACGIYLLLRRIKNGTFRQIVNSSFRIQIISAITPGRLGDIWILYYLKDEYTPGQISAIFFIDKIITICVNIILSIIGVGLFFSWKQAVGTALFLTIFFLFLIAFLFLSPHNLVAFNFFKKIIPHLQGVRTEMRSTVKDVKGLAANLILTIIRYILAGVFMLLLLFGFGQNAALIDVILIQSIAQLATFIPLTTMGIGVTEAVCVSLFNIIGISSEVVLAALLWSRAIYLMFVASIYLLWTGNPIFVRILNKFKL